MKTIMSIILIIVLSNVCAFPEVMAGDILNWRIFTMDREGYIYTDGDFHSINKYSPEGKFILKMGQNGEGPSDIKRLGWFAIHPVDPVIYVTEYINGNKWISKFSTDGRYLGNWKCDLDLKKYEALLYIKFDGEGNVYLQAIKTIPKRLKDFTIFSEKSIIIKFSPGGKILKEFYNSCTDTNAYSYGKGDITIPFQNHLSWNVYQDKLIVEETNSNSISIFSKEGKLEKKISLPFAKEKVTENDLNEWEARLKDNPIIKKNIEQGIFDIKYWRNRLPFPVYKPVSSGVQQIDSDGNLFLKNGADKNWMKIDLSSGACSPASFAQEGNLFFINKSYFFFWQMDDDNNVIITKIDEKELFKKIKNQICR